MSISVGLQLFHSGNQVRQPHPLSPLVVAGSVYMARQHHRFFESWQNLRYDERIACPHRFLTSGTIRQVDGKYLAYSIGVDALQFCTLPERIVRQAAGYCHHVRNRGARTRLVYRWSLNRTANRHGVTKGRHENDISRLQPSVIRCVAVQQQVVKIEGRNRLTVSFQLYVTQRAHPADAAAAIQSAADRRESANDEGAWPVGIAEHEYTNRFQLPHRDTDLRAD